MLKIGERELTTKDLILAGVLALVAAAAIWAMMGSKPKPIIGQAPPPARAGLVLMEGGQPGAGPGQFNYPRGIAVNSKGEMFVADSRNHRIQKFSPAKWQFVKEFGSFANVGGGDPKKLANMSPGKLNEPNGLCIGPDDNVYVIDTWNSRVQIFSSNGGLKKVFASEDGFFGPREIVADPKGFVFVADTGRHRIVKFDPKGLQVRAFGIKGDKPGQFNEPIGLALDQAGNLYVADRLNFRIQVFNSEGQYLREWHVDGWAQEQVDMEPHLAMDSAKGLLYVTDGRGKKVFAYHVNDGSLAATLEKDSNGGNLFSTPIGVAVDKDGNVYVTDASTARIYKLKGQ